MIDSKKVTINAISTIPIVPQSQCAQNQMIQFTSHRGINGIARSFLIYSNTSLAMSHTLLSEIRKPKESSGLQFNISRGKKPKQVLPSEPRKLIKTKTLSQNNRTGTYLLTFHCNPIHTLHSQSTQRQSKCEANKIRLI